MGLRLRGVSSLPGLGVFEVAGHVLKLVHDEKSVLAIE